MKVKENNERKIIKEATVKILKEYGIETEKDLENLDKVEGAVLYETLKAGIMEEYDIEWDELAELADELLKV